MLPELAIAIEDLLLDSAKVNKVDGIVSSIISPENITLALGANAQYFGHPQWAKNYFEACHRDRAFIDRWQAATGSWDNKIVVDLGCGPGNVFASVGGNPKLLVGVDISLGGLKMAKELGYQPLLADIQSLPIQSEIADVVVLNATLHHCDDMKAVLQEAGRLVKPGGVLVSDHDLQKTAWDFKGLARHLWELRLPVYRCIGRGGHSSYAEQQCALATEIHHIPGDGLATDFFHSVLHPMGFSVQVYPHNHDLGRAIFTGQIGRAPWKYRLAQQLSGINPNTSEAALSLMCVAHRSQ
jgi:SAM-dependent methyltransferase